MTHPLSFPAIHRRYRHARRACGGAASMASLALAAALGATPASAAGCDLVVRGLEPAQSAGPARAQYEVRPIAHVESRSGHWAHLDPIRHDVRPNGGRVVHDIRFRLSDGSMCAQDLIVRLGGTCTVSAASGDGRVKARYTSELDIWLTPRNRPSAQREFKAGLCS